MKNDDELVKRIVAGIQAMPLRGGKYTDLEDVARAAIAVMREAGWTPPPPPKSDRLYFFEQKKPATSEGAG